MSIVILSGRSLLADGVASQLRQADLDLDFHVVNPRQPGAIDQIVSVNPSVVIMDGTDRELAEFCPLGQLVDSLPTVRIIWLNPQQEHVQLVTSELRVATQVSDLIDLIAQT